MNKTNAVFSWSGGKDSAWALHQVLQEGVYDVKFLLSTFNGNFHRLSMHGVREELIEAQASLIGIPLIKVYVFGSDNEEYESQMAAALSRLIAEGISTILYGDIFLEDLRIYREQKMGKIGLTCAFPVWKKDTRQLATDFIATGFKTVLCCVNDAWLDESYAGRLFDDDLLQSLPENVDPCGENGEFHSFCFDGPLFREPIAIVTGEKMYRPLVLKQADTAGDVTEHETKGFWFIDLLFQRVII